MSLLTVGNEGFTAKYTAQDTGKNQICITRLRSYMEGQSLWQTNLADRRSEARSNKIGKRSLTSGQK